MSGMHNIQFPFQKILLMVLFILTVVKLVQSEASVKILPPAPTQRVIGNYIGLVDAAKQAWKQGASSFFFFL